jgi:hypothetical protein
MGLTLGLLASVLVMLPGLAVLAAFNFRTRRGGARRPELPLTAVSSLVLAAVFSIIIHAVGYSVTAGALDFVVALHDKWPQLNAGVVIQNPIEGFYEAVADKRPMSFGTAYAFAFLLLGETLAGAAFVMSELFQLSFDSHDFNAQGWVFEHITRPAENGYTPVGHVFTSLMSGDYGVAYKGPVVDVRQGDKGEILSISLARPERFLYQLGAFADQPEGRRWFWQKSSSSEVAKTTGVEHHEKDYVGGIVHLDARVIGNIVVHSIADVLLEEIDSTVPDEAVEITA